MEEPARFGGFLLGMTFSSFSLALPSNEMDKWVLCFVSKKEEKI